MKSHIKISLLFGFLFLLLPFQLAHAETLQDELNNLVGPNQQYNTKLSPVYLETNHTSQSISPQSGELTLTQTDYVLPGRNGLDLKIKRIYKSGVSNVRNMQVKYVDGAWVDYVHADDKTSSFYEQRYDLGIGMRFSFPAIEVRPNSDNSSTMFLHTDSGDVYHLTTSTLNGENVWLPEGQTVKDVVVKSSSAFSNGQSDGTSKFVMTEKDGKKTYFASDGRILGIVDRYGNTITFDYTTIQYHIDGQTITKRLIGKIIDTVGRVVTMEYKQDENFTVGPISNNAYTADTSYMASQNPNNTDSGDLHGKFQVIVHLPGNKKIIYDKSAALVSSSKHVIRTRLQRVYDVDGKVKYHYWYEQPDLGFTYMNGTHYSVYNRYENLVQIDYCKTNRIKRFVYNTYTKRLNQGSMQYRKIFAAEDLIKQSYDPSQSKFLDRFVTKVKDKTTYTYTHEPDGFGTSGYNALDEGYLKNTFRYDTKVTELNGSSTTYTYDGVHELLTTVKQGNDHKEVITTARDEMKLLKKKETDIYPVSNGQTTGPPVKKIENYRYDEYGNLTNYTGPMAERDADGYPLNSDHTVIYTYAYDKYFVLTSKTWKKDKDTTEQILYDVDSKGNVIKKTNVGTGTYTDYQYDAYGNMTEQAVHSGAQTFITHYEYGTDANGADMKGAYLTRKYGTTADGKVSATQYAYDFNTGNMTKEIDPNGHTTVYAYDVLSRVIKVTQPDQTVKTYEYDQQPYANFTIKYTDPRNIVHVFTYDIMGNLLQASAIANGKTHVLNTYEYDAKGNKTKETDANGNVIQYGYDSEYRLVRKTYMAKGTVDKGSLTIAYTVGADADTPLLVTITDQDGYIKKYHYDLLDRLVKLESTPDNKTFYADTYTYDYVGDKLTQTDALGHTTHFQYDMLGRMTSKTDALGYQTAYVYNALNKVTQKTEPGGKVTAYTFDALGRLSKRKIYKNGSSDYTYASYAYDPAGNVLEVGQGQVVGGQDELASDTSYTYDAMNRKTDETDKIDANRTEHIHDTYDADGNKTEEIQYANAAETQFFDDKYAYDYAGRVLDKSGAYKEANGSGGYTIHGSYDHKFTYDDAGNLIQKQVQDGSGYDVTTFAYNYLNEVVSKTQPYIDNEQVKKTTYQYDKRGNLTVRTLTVQGQPETTTYAYDGMGNKTSMTDPLGGTTRYRYDAVGNLVKKIDPRYMSTAADQAPGLVYAYDALNQLIKTSVFDGKTSTVIDYKAYDGRGNLVLDADGVGYNVDAPSQSIGKVYTYDVLDRKTSYISAQTDADNKTDGTHHLTASYTYDALGNVLSKTDALGNKTTFAYYLNGMLKTKTYPDGKTDQYDYDLTGNAKIVKTDRAGHVTTTTNNDFGKPYRIDYPDGTHVTFAYSTRGNLIQKVDQAGNPTFYTYDPSGNLLTEKAFMQSDGTYDSYKLTKNTYDEANRQLTQETFQDQKPISGGSDTLTSIGDKTVNTYDKAGRLIRVSGPFGRETDNAYDRAGNLITRKQKVSDGHDQVVRYAYDVQSRLIRKSRLIPTTELESSALANVQFDNEYFDRVLSTTTFSYYKNGQVKSKTDPLGNTTSYAYDDNGRMTKMTDPLQAATKLEYDGNGNLIAKINAKGIATTYEYDSLNRLIRRKAPSADGGQAVTRYLYDAMGNLVKQIAPNQYDAAKDTPDLAKTMTGTSYTYDAMNRRTSTVSPNGVGLKYMVYDAVGRLRKVVDGLRYTGNLDTSPGTVYTYDALGDVVKKTDALGNSTTYAYDVLGDVIRKTDALNYTTDYAYNPDGTLKSVTYPDGGVARYTYDKMGRKISETDPRGNTTTYSYNNFGKLNRVTDPYGHPVVSKADLAGHFVSRKDKRGSVTLFQYDADGRLVEKKTPLRLDASGNVAYAVETNLYDKLGNVTRKTVTDSKDATFVRQTNYTYTDNNLVASVTDNSGADTENTYDLNGNLIQQKKLRDGSHYDIEQYTYDNQNRMTQDIQWVEESDIANAASLPNISALRDAGHPGLIRFITGYEYDILGNKTKEILPQAYGYLASDTADRAKYTVTTTYDALNRPVKVIRNVNGTDVYTQTTYDAVGNKTAVRNPRGYVTTYTYDNMDRVIQVTDPKKQTMTTTYDKAGNKTSVTDARGDTMTYTYDKLNRRVTTIDAFGRVINKNIYDVNGNVTKKIDAKGYLSASDDADRYGWLYTYDLANRLIRTVDPELAAKHNPALSTATYTYDAAGNKISETDALGNTTTYTYDNANRLIQVTDPLGTTTTYAYDKAGNKQYIVNGRGKLTPYTYGAFGLLLSATNPDKKAIQYTYDLGQHIAVMTDRNGNHTQYIYDSRGLLLSKTVTETGDTVSFTYDADGNRASMQDASGNSTYTYDANDQLLNVTKDGKSQVTYTVDKVGNIASVKDPTGFTTTYTYDKSNRMKTVTFKGQTTTYTYDVNGNRTAIAYAGGVTESYTYDKNNRLLALRNKAPDGSVISKYDYTYDNAGRKSSKTDSLGTTNDKYDADGRITEVDAPGKTTVYTYDASGNRESLNETYTSAQPSDYTDPNTNKPLQYLIKKSEYIYSNADRLLRLVETMEDGSGHEVLVKTTDYLYDNNGNELREKVSYVMPYTSGMRQVTGGNLFGNGIRNPIKPLIESVSNTFDGFNRLVETENIKGGERSTVDFVYNGDGLRTKKTVRSSKAGYTAKITNYIYDRQHVILETDGANLVSVRYVRGLNYIARMDASNKLSYYLFNGHGDVVQTVSNIGVVENRYEYDIWGNATLTIEQYANTIRYSGEFYDSKTGLYYLRARYYNPYTGRFISEDSIWGEDTNPLSLNLYTYTHNDPINYTDPTGHWEKGDENLSVDDQKKIKDLTDAYVNATSKAERNRIHAEADQIRENAAMNGEYNHGERGDSFTSAVNNAISNSKYKDQNGNQYITPAEWKKISKAHDRRSGGNSKEIKKVSSSGESIDTAIHHIERHAENNADYHIGSKEYSKEISQMSKEIGNYSTLKFVVNDAEVNTTDYRNAKNNQVKQIRFNKTINSLANAVDNEHNDSAGVIKRSDIKYKLTNPFVYGQLQFMQRAWTSAGEIDPSPSTQKDINNTANYLRYVADSHSNFAIISLDTFLPLDNGVDPEGNIFRGNGKLRDFHPNDIGHVKTLQYGVVNLDYNSVVGFNYATVTQRVDEKNKVLEQKRDSNRGMAWLEGNLDINGDSHFTSVGAITSVKNELSASVNLGFDRIHLTPFTPAINYITNVQITNASKVKVTYTLDKFPSYEGYISINGGNFNPLYRKKAIPFHVNWLPNNRVFNNQFYNLIPSRKTHSDTFTYDSNYGSK